MKQLRSNQKRAKNAIILIWIVLALEIISFISAYLQYDLLQTVANCGEVSIEAANANDIRETVVSAIYLMVCAISTITFIMWFRRAYFNLHQKVTWLSYGEGWAAGSWFVPFYNLYRPYKIMNELHQGTKDILGINTHSNIVGWWWCLFLASNIIGNFATRFLWNAKAIEQLSTATMACMITDVLGIASALVTVKIIKDYSNIETLLYQRTEHADQDTKKMQFNCEK